MVYWPNQIDEEEEISQEEPCPRARTTTLRFLGRDGVRVRKMSWDGKVVGTFFMPRRGRSSASYFLHVADGSSSPERTAPAAEDSGDDAIGLHNWTCHSPTYTARRMPPAQLGSRRYESLPNAIGLANWDVYEKDEYEQGVWAKAHMALHSAGRVQQEAEPSLEEQWDRIWANVDYLKRQESLLLAFLDNMPAPTQEREEILIQWPESLEEENVADLIAVSDIAQSILELAEGGVPVKTLAAAGVLNSWDTPDVALWYECCKLGEAIAEESPMLSLFVRDYIQEQEDLINYYAEEAELALHFRSLAGIHDNRPLNFNGDYLSSKESVIFHDNKPLDFSGGYLEEDEPTLSLIDTPIETVSPSPVLIATPQKSPTKPSRAQLHGSPYKEIKTLAAKLGIDKRFATKNELIKDIMSANEGWEQL